MTVRFVVGAMLKGLQLRLRSCHVSISVKKYQFNSVHTGFRVLLILFLVRGGRNIPSGSIFKE